MPLFLSAVDLNPAHEVAAREAGDTWAMHVRVAQVMSGANGRVLWAQPAPGRLVVQGATPLSEVHLPRGYATGIRAVDITSRIAAFRSGQRVTWSLLANPTRGGSRKVDGGRVRGPIVLVPREERDAWALRQLGGALAVTRVTGRDLGTARGRKPTTGQTISHLRHLFTGEGVVTDPVRLAALIAGGVGRGKAFGCGLLVVAAADGVQADAA